MVLWYIQIVQLLLYFIYESDASIKKIVINFNGYKKSDRKFIKFTYGIPLIAISIDESYVYNGTEYGTSLTPSYVYIINDNRGNYYIDEVMLWQSSIGCCSLIIVYYI